MHASWAAGVKGITSEPCPHGYRRIIAVGLLTTYITQLPTSAQHSYLTSCFPSQGNPHTYLSAHVSPPLRHTHPRPNLLHRLHKSSTSTATSPPISSNCPNTLRSAPTPTSLAIAARSAPLYPSHRSLTSCSVCASASAAPSGTLRTTVRMISTRVSRRANRRTRACQAFLGGTLRSRSYRGGSSRRGRTRPRKLPTMRSGIAFLAARRRDPETDHDEPW
ncbi:hypothetical protein OE88DRAFT_1218470 [Heliocybe sulcata]|uniref:Uncharacterized protein n=1 Tax=Heliocybe sulcata TaxID=5364 RepID=A0A5C3MMX2_9AGAM|nr:hypothetical protein OE88DRAFT_1218470 [Heliocybe sulcata]